MPIRAENRARYPKEWPEIRARILARASDRCERCGVRNGATGYRTAEGVFYETEGMETEVAALDGLKVIRIVLTIAHVHDPDPANCADDNLQALCQACHNRLDAPMRARNAAETRRRKRERWQPSMIEVTP